MHLRRAQQRLVAVFTALVMTFAALSPAIASALAEPGANAWVDLCTADGSKRVVVNAVGEVIERPPNGTTADQNHCPFCHFLHAPAALPSAFVAVWFSNSATDTFHALFVAAARPRYAWVSAQSRAPPTRS